MATASLSPMHLSDQVFCGMVGVFLHGECREYKYYKPHRERERERERGEGEGKGDRKNDNIIKKIIAHKDITHYCNCVYFLT